MEDLLKETYWGNTILQYLIAAGFFIGGIIIVTIFKTLILIQLKKWVEKSKTTIDDFIIVGIQKSIVPILFYGSLYIALRTLTLSPEASNILNIASVFVITFFAIRLITSILDYSITTYSSMQEAGDQKAKQLKSLSALARFLVWGIGLIFLMDNLGFDISAVIAGLGIGGIAVALAAQSILGDLFSYFTIFFDRPFELGDYILVGDKNGTVEHIGIKTTRIRALSGEQLVFSNTDLTSSRIHNYKKLQRRRISFQLGVIYETSSDKLQKINKIVEEIIKEEANALFDRGHFKSFGDFSLNFEFVYFVLGREYTKYMNVQQAINYKIFEEFSKEGIEFAYPTQTLFMNKINGEDSNKEAA
jgi:small-conductance mechanosensitive channel